VYTRATKAELNGELQKAFKLYVLAAEEFLHLSRTTPDAASRTQCKAEAIKALERAEKIKNKKNDLTPVAKDHLSERTAILHLCVPCTY
jgi:calpain-7